MLAGIKILIVEDNLVDQVLATHMLKKQNAIPTCAATGEEALYLFDKNAYDVVLMDTQMPGINGYETTALIRKKTGDHIPVIAVTADVFVNNTEKWKEAGMNGCIIKPFDPDNLCRVISDILVNSGNNISKANA